MNHLINEQILALVAEGKFFGTVLHYKEGEIVFDEGFGLADREKVVSNAPHFQYNLGSINKLFTNIAIAQLLQQNKLCLDAFAKQYVPELYVTDSEKITVAHLLGMESGLGDYLTDPAYTAQREKFAKMVDYLPLITAQQLAFSPGTDKRYANLGYELLGIIVERVSGVDYYDYIRTHLFDKAGMVNSGYFTEDNKTAVLATGYIKKEERFYPNWDVKPYKGTAAGGGYSTTHDMLRLGLALFDNQLLDQMHTDLIFSNFQTITEPNSRIIVGGGAPGINAIFYVDRIDKEIVVVLANQGPPAASIVCELFVPLRRR